MLIQFSVENYRCFRDRATISFVASNDRALPDNAFTVDAPSCRGMRLLRSAAIYGPNASGKSTLVEALRFFRDFVHASAAWMQENDPIAVAPFGLDSGSARKPTEFEAVFVAENIRYRYGFAVDEARVLREWLHAAPHRQERLLFHRERNGDRDDYAFGPSFSGGSSGRAALRERTRDNALFLSVAAQFNHPQATAALGWFTTRFPPPILASQRWIQGLEPFTAMEAERDATFHAQVVRLLRNADLGISGFRISRKKLDPAEILGAPPVLLGRVRRTAGQAFEMLDIRTTHEMCGGPDEERAPIEFLLRHESDGTQALFALAGPILSVLGDGDFLAIDEIDASLHTALLRALVEPFHSPETNARGAQLLFTLHDTNLLDPRLLRRDQIWLTEKDATGAARLTPLLDFKPRKGEALAKGYLQGRYGGVPVLESLFPAPVEERAR